MTARLAAFVALTASIAVAADEPKPTVLLKPDKIEIKRGEPLSDRCLVTTPLPFKGVVAWSWETRRHRGRVPSMALSPDGKLVATGGYDGTIRLWDAETGELGRALIGHDSYVYALSFSPDGAYLASGGSFDATARVWEVKTGLPVRVIKGHPSYITQVAWSPDGKTLAVAGGESGDASTFDLKTGKLGYKVALGQPVYSMSWSPDCTRIAMVARNLGGVAVWDMGVGKIAEPFGAAASTMLYAEFSPDGKHLAAGDKTSTYVYHADTRKEVKKLVGGGNVVRWSPDGKRLGSASHADAKITIWDGESFEQLQSGPAPSFTFFFSNDNTKFHSTNTITLFAFDIKTGKQVSSHEITGEEPPLWWAGRPVVTGVGTPSLQLWDASTGKKSHLLEGHTGAVAAVAWSPDAKQLATASADKTVRIWNPADGKATQTWSEHKGPIAAVAWSPDGKWVASGGQDKTVLICDAASGKVSHTLADHTGAVKAIAWSPSAAGYLATGSDDTNTNIYSTKTWKKLKTLEEKSVVYSIGWAPDGKTVAVGYADAKTRLFAPASGKEINELEAQGSPPYVTAVAYAPTGALIATGMANHTMQLWNARGGQRTQAVQTQAPVRHMAWGTGGAFLAVSSGDRTTRFFDPATGRLRGVYIAEDEQIIAVSADGNYRAEGEALEELVAVVLTDKGQETLTPAAFAEKYKWKNNPAATKFANK